MGGVDKISPLSLTQRSETYTAELWARGGEGFSQRSAATNATWLCSKVQLWLVGSLIGVKRNIKYIQQGRETKEKHSIKQ